MKLNEITLSQNEIYIAGRLDIDGWHDQAKRIYGIQGVAPCINAQSNNLLVKILVLKRSELDVETN